MVFTELLKMLDREFSAEFTESLLQGVELKSGGVFTATGNYDYREMVQLIEALSERTGTPAADLQRSFGTHLFGRFAELYGEFFRADDDTFSFLKRVDENIHVEVKKLYPDAELPNFDYRQPDSDALEMTYRSKRPFADLAEGLIEGCIAHFGEDITLSRQDNPGTPGTSAIFLLTRNQVR